MPCLWYSFIDDQVLWYDEIITPEQAKEAIVKAHTAILVPLGITVTEEELRFLLNVHTPPVNITKDGDPDTNLGKAQIASKMLARKGFDLRIIVE